MASGHGGLALSRRGCIFTMADRYQDRPFPADDDYDRGANRMRRKGESDPLAELARLIGQTDPFGAAAEATAAAAAARQCRAPQYEPPDDAEEASAPAGPPPWMQRARQEAPRRSSNTKTRSRITSRARCIPCIAMRPSSRRRHEPDYHEPQPLCRYAERAAADPSRYDDALYGQLESGEQDYAARSGLSGRSLRLSERLRGRADEPTASAAAA